MYRIRTAYYNLVGRLTDVQVISHFTGFGIYDRRVVEIMKEKFRDPVSIFPRHDRRDRDFPRPR